MNAEVTDSGPVVSVVMTVRNNADTLPVAFDAMEAQEWPVAGEVVMADNGSTDDSAAIARSYADRLPNLRVIDAADAKGYPGGLKAAVAASRGRYLLFLDGDDRILPGYVAAMVATLEAEAREGRGLVGGTLVFDNDLNPEPWRAKPDQVPAPVLKHAVAAPGCAQGMTRELWDRLDGHDVTMPRLADVELCFRADRLGSPMAPAEGARLDYRTTTGLRVSWNKGTASGRDHVRLAIRYPQVASQWRTRRQALRHTARLLVNPPVRNRPEGRQNWVWRMAVNWGRFRESRAEGVTYW